MTPDARLLYVVATLLEGLPERMRAGHLAPKCKELARQLERAATQEET